MWIDTTSSETAANLETRLQGLNAEVPLTSHAPTSIAYSAHGLILRQKESVTVSEFRSLTQAAADKLATRSSDSTTTTVYYKQISESGEYAAVAITTGSKTDYVPSRANEADGWHVTKTVTDYSAAAATGWSTTRPTVATTGIIVSEDADVQFLAAGALGERIFQHTSTVVREYPFLTYDDAQDKVSNEKAAGSRVYDEKVVTSWSTTEGVTTFKFVTVRGGTSGSQSHGTDKVPTMRYDGPERGWVVTVTETTYCGSSHD